RGFAENHAGADPGRISLLDARRQLDGLLVVSLGERGLSFVQQDFAGRLGLRVAPSTDRKRGKDYESDSRNENHSSTSEITQPVDRHWHRTDLPTVSSQS